MKKVNYVDWHFVDFGFIRLRFYGLSERQLMNLEIEKLHNESTSRDVWGIRIPNKKGMII